LSPGGAAWILLVLGTACVVQLPGSLILPFHQGLYRLAPEIGFLEACGVIVLVARGVFTFKQSFRRSVKATFALRKALGDGHRWWMDDFMDNRSSLSLDTPVRPLLSSEGISNALLSKHCTPSEAYYKLEPFLSSVRRFSPGRFLALLLTVIALVKACIISGTIKTTALAICYALSFFPIEVFTWVLLDVRLQRSKAELQYPPPERGHPPILQLKSHFLHVYSLMTVDSNLIMNISAERYCFSLAIPLFRIFRFAFIMKL
jgi:hypothetical protein